VVQEKELRLRQALACMGMHDLAHGLAWHIHQALRSLVSALILCGAGRAWGISLFVRVDVGVPQQEAVAELRPAEARGPDRPRPEVRLEVDRRHQPVLSEHQGARFLAAGGPTAPHTHTVHT
jgi:hypothetical protein